jgi:glycosyltransferase involved in cell wall biosynthesis
MKLKKEKLTVGFLTAMDPRDKRSWSGTQYRMLTALENEFEEVIPLGPIPRPRIIGGIIVRIDKLSRFLFKKKYNREQNILKSIYYYFYLKEIIKTSKIDVIFSSSAGPEIAFIKTKIPICYLADATFDQLLGYYSDYSNFAPFSIKEARYISKKAIDKSKSYVYPSSWAANYAMNCYKLNQKDTHVVKFGANMDYTPDVNRIKERSYNSEINLLFLGRNWGRKGGEIVLETLDILIKKGYNVKLTVCGCVPPVKHSKMYVIPFLNKNLKNERDTFHNLLYQSHILFVPTRAECYGIVFCEASAFGIPIVTTDTGGVTSVVENNINGYALPYDALPKDYALQIEKLLDSPLLIKDMASKSLSKYEKELNWGFWGKKMREILVDTIDK